MSSEFPGAAESAEGSVCVAQMERAKGCSEKGGMAGCGCGRTIRSLNKYGLLGHLRAAGRG